MGSFATILEEILIALERANASFEKGSFRNETGGDGWRPPLNRRDAVREK